MLKFRIVSDVHGKWKQYKRLISDCNYSIQLGDLGYWYDYLEHINNCHHICMRGNHEAHNECDKWPHFLPHSYGLRELGGLQFFYVSGAFSIDWQIRRKYYFSGKWPQTWWPEEELPIPVLESGIITFSEVKPKVVLTHECPRSIAKIIGSSDILKEFGFDPVTFTTRTSEALECMFQAHKPDLWIFGHFHRFLDITVDGTRFICKPELGYTDLFVENGKIERIEV